jgi:nicotinate-nucleotide adenylyltransferase
VGFGSDFTRGKLSRPVFIPAEFLCQVIVSTGFNAKTSMRIGLFGGTFNPIHWGHLRSAEEAREAFNLDRVLFIPTANPPHKKRPPISAQARARMVRMAIAGHEPFRLSTVELRRSGKSYTVDTLRYFAARARGTDLYYFIIGLDAFSAIETWKDFGAIFGLCNFIVTSRPGFNYGLSANSIPIAVRELFCYVEKERAFRHASGRYLAFLRITDIAIAASEIRERVANRKSIRYLVPSLVEAYIRRNRLYRKKVESR